MLDAIVVVTHKKSYFLSRLCISSIRYFYPDIKIYLIKDLLSGAFDTTELEHALDEKILDLGISKFGWSAAKVHLQFSEELRGKKILSLDEDIIFAGKFLESLSTFAQEFDFVVDPDLQEDPYQSVVKDHYYKIDEITAFDPNFEYPGYVFNGGQMVVTPGIISKEELAPLFDLKEYPYYKRRDILHQVDQSLLNYFLPRQAQKGNLRLGAFPFMKWSDSLEIKQDLVLDDLLAGEKYKFLIHYAGVLRVPDISQMTRPDILEFFEDFYYKHVPNGQTLKAKRRLAAKADFNLRKIYRKIFRS